MQMADNCQLDLRQPGANHLLAPKEGEGRRIMAKEQDTLVRSQCAEYLANLSQMLLAQPLPFVPFGGKGISFEHR